MVLTDLTYSDGESFGYAYSTGHDDTANRVSRLVDSADTPLVSYDYQGLNQLVGATYETIDVYSTRYDQSSGDLDHLDRFNRVTTDRWSRELSPGSGGDLHFYDTIHSWDRNSNVTQADDQVYPDQDVDYTMDDLNRLTLEERSDGASLRFSSDLGMTLAGAITDNDYDWDGDGSVDYAYSRQFNEANELIEDSHGAVGGVSSLYLGDPDATGNLTTGYVYDVWGRATEVGGVDYRYNGLGHRIAATEPSGVEYFFVYDTSWRILETYREDDADPKERFLYHNAGLDGRGG